MVDLFDLAWAAGVIDGEGCVGIYSYPGKTHLQERTRIAVTNTDPMMLEKLQGLFGGSVYKKGHGSLGKRPCYTWQVEGRRAEDAAVMVLPFAVTKAQQLEVLLAFRRLVGRPYGGHSESTRQQRAALKTKIARLKVVA